MYSNNIEYRAAIRSYFKMNVQPLEKEYEYLKKDDPESYDELLYDDEAMKQGMNILYDKTKDNQRFLELYKIAAGKFLTEDLQIGICVLLTYDYFYDFILLFENPTDESLWQRLLSKLL